MENRCILIVDDHALFRTGLSMILSDIQMPGLDGTKVLKEKFSNTPIIMLSASHDTGDMQDALDSGAGGFLPKPSSAEIIIKAISAVLNDKQCFPENKVLRLHSNNNKQPQELTSRQLQVLSLLCEGKPNKIIARELNVFENTVHVHVSVILSLLNVASRSEAMLVAQKQGLISLNT